MNKNIILLIIVIISIIIIVTKTEFFYIEPNTVQGGAMIDSGMIMDTSGHYIRYSAPLELPGGIST